MKMVQRRLGLKNGKSGAVLAVRVTTRSSSPGIAGIMDDYSLKVHLASAPVDGKANDELIKILAKTFDCPKKDIEIIAGIAIKTKLVAIYGLDSDLVNKIINRVIKDLR
jgi:uncharacterized protein